MEYLPCLMSVRRFSPVLLTGLGLLISGCATFQEQTCEQFEEQRKDTDYTTQYQPATGDPETVGRLSKLSLRGKPVAIRLYKIDIDPPAIKPCNNLTIHKAVYIQRGSSTGQVLEEVREFYTAKGELITTKTESVGDQFRASGYYAAELPLPIPEKAPPGNYRIVSKLIMKTKNKSRGIVLARTNATFQVVSRK